MGRHHRRHYRKYRTIRSRLLKKHPFCVICLKSGVHRLADEMDHIRPLDEGGSLLDPDNLRGLCVECHVHRHRPKNDSDGASIRRGRAAGWSYATR